MNNSEFSQKKVLKGCLADDRLSQEALYRHFAKKMYAICLSYAGDRPAAQDILQESFIKIFKNIKNYKNNGSLEGWIRRIVTNTSIDYLRSRKLATGYIEEELDINNKQTSTLSIIGFNELMEQVNRLPKGAKLIFNLHALDGYTHKEIAQKLEISEGTSKSQFNRARKLLMNFLGSNIRW